ncbi:cuticle collagen 1-like [Choloepus didactylus]|uniref:cuticle collagen 1-like n=1 Tax=Choloepus didactylus TaxID=27675 RepID=UPI00189E697A|nr:cuticle collagen 1-like [Choloepus didactylus]
MGLISRSPKGTGGRQPVPPPLTPAPQLPHQRLGLQREGPEGPGPVEQMEPQPPPVAAVPSAARSPGRPWGPCYPMSPGPRPVAPAPPHPAASASRPVARPGSSSPTDRPVAPSALPRPPPAPAGPRGREARAARARDPEPAVPGRAGAHRRGAPLPPGLGSSNSPPTPDDPQRRGRPNPTLPSARGATSMKPSYSNNEASFYLTKLDAITRANLTHGNFLDLNEKELKSWNKHRSARGR